MNILCVGDVVGRIGREYLRQKLPLIKKNNNIDAVIVNGENSCSANGISINSATEILDSGADTITTGNHAFKFKEINSFFDDTPQVIRPLNWSGDPPGNGIYIIDKGSYSIAVINLIGTSYMDWAKNPFECLDKALATIDTKIIIVDFHAETTSEKAALAYYADGRVTAVVGTHTHVQTSDARLLPQKTAFITDLGMTGPINSILGVRPEIIVSKFLSNMPQKFENGNGACMLNGAIIQIDEKTGKAYSIESINIQ